MNKNDIHLNSFFLDYEGISANQYEPKISSFIKEAVKIFENNLYTSINVQDKDGNTFLHHAMYSNNRDWIHKLLKKGGNPLIKNNKDLNAFRYASKKYNSNYKVNLDDKFNFKTSGFCHDFKQLLFDEAVLKGTTNKNQFYEINSYLESIGLISDKNKVNLCFHNLHIPIETRVNYYLSHFDSPENNSHCLNCWLFNIGRTCLLMR